MMRDILRCRIRLAFIAMCLLACITSGAHAAGLGRLFFTPEQRTQLDQAHAAATENGASVLVVNGIVQKRGGARTVWVNGVAQHAGHSDEHSPDAIPVAVPGKPRPVKVKVGQQLHLEQPAAQLQIAPSK